MRNLAAESIAPAAPSLEEFDMARPRMVRRLRQRLRPFALLRRTAIPACGTAVCVAALVVIAAVLAASPARGPLLGVILTLWAFAVAALLAYIVTSPLCEALEREIEGLLEQHESLTGRRL
jgi:hypothetical protein